MKTEDLILALMQDHYELVEKIVKQELQKLKSSIEEDIERIDSGRPVRAFSMDMQEDRAILQSKIEALDTVLDYYMPIGCLSGD